MKKMDLRNGNYRLTIRAKPSPASGASAMIGVINREHKRVCNVSKDAKVVEIRKRDCVTRIKANTDGTLEISNE